MRAEGRFDGGRVGDRSGLSSGLTASRRSRCARRVRHSTAAATASSSTANAARATSGVWRDDVYADDTAALAGAGGTPAPGGGACVSSAGGDGEGGMHTAVSAWLASVVSHGAMSAGAFARSDTQP